ncbi:peroxiredoxin [Aurantiacibacter aquimixticola]|uniref:thioredoxin-dependent peroxiredoxin n=1 Tax=Aurantiacibacter aquimixticola TaxID=1958945 RepID=A0A419RUM4_9SPHN|nr:peroxiredoxin [Aurantiacibacter aquimixticola]RJY09482.1 peroxiredoxin [Aurantiacibacter aquimixticola]
MTTRPEAGDAMLDVMMETPDGGTVKPSDFRGRKLVMFFYPKDDTPGCTTENKDFTALKHEFAAADTALLGVSKDPPAKHQKFIAKHDLAVPLASDTPAESDEDGIAEALGIWVEKNMYGKKYMGMERTTYLVAADGKIKQVWRKVKVKGHADEVLAAAKAL